MSKVINPVTSFPRLVRSVPDPLALYLRIGRNDYRAMLNLIATGDVPFFGVVFDPSRLELHHELKDQIRTHQLDSVIDPKTQQLALPGSYSRVLGGLPWGNPDRPHCIADFEGTSGQRLIATLGDYVIEHGFTQVIAPTHILSSANDPWFDLDLEAARRLRSYLDRGRGSTVDLIYSLAMPYSVFRNMEQRSALINRLKTVPASALWLKIDHFGHDSSPSAALTYISAAAEFHELGVPIVGGVIGLSLMAFGAVGGMSHGITLGERFNADAWHKAPVKGAFGAHRRIYIPSLDMQMKPKEAEALLGVSNRARAMFGCADTECCRRGIDDMLKNPARHFLYQRTKEVNELGRVPENLRPQSFLDRHLRSATDKALVAANINWEDTLMAKKMQNNRKRLDALRVVLSNRAERTPPQTFAELPKTLAARGIRQ